VGAQPLGPDARPMKLLDRDPGLLMVLAFGLVYGFILVEIGMWASGSLTAVFVVLGAEVLVALAPVRATGRFLASEGAAEEEPERAPHAAPAPSPALRAPGHAL
jgi:hypothetical protein